MKGYKNSKVPWLFEILEERGIKAKELAIATGISAGSITDWKVGKSAPTGARLSAIAKYLNVDIEYLISGTEPEKNVNLSAEDEERKRREKEESDRIIKSISDTLNGMSKSELTKVEQIVKVIKE